MRVIDPKTGRTYHEKRRRRYDEICQARELTFSCYHRYPLLKSDRTREWSIEALESARSLCRFDLWAYVLMPDHVHLLIYPTGADASISQILRKIKEPVARRAIAFLKHQSGRWLSRLTVHEGQRVRRRFWQPGGGYDRNIDNSRTLNRVIDYIHANPVRRGLCERAEDWEWSSARWYAGIGPAKIDMDQTIPGP